MAQNSQRIILGGEIWGLRCLIDGLRADLENLRTDAFRGGVEAVHDDALELAKVLDFAADRLRSAVEEPYTNVLASRDFLAETKQQAKGQK